MKTYDVYITKRVKDRSPMETPIMILGTDAAALRSQGGLSYLQVQRDNEIFVVPFDVIESVSMIEKKTEKSQEEIKEIFDEFKENT